MTLGPSVASPVLTVTCFLRPWKTLRTWVLGCYFHPTLDAQSALFRNAVSGRSWEACCIASDLDKEWLVLLA